MAEQEFVPGSELPALRLTHSSGASCLVALFGAHVVSWRTSGGVEQLFLSERSILDGTKPIRGGIPIAFPRFGPSETLPNHGFARTSVWALVKGDASSATSSFEATFVLTDSVATRAIWPNRFELRYTVSLTSGGSLRTSLAVTNTGDEPIAFQALLHTYFLLKDGIESVRVSGLQDVEFFDKLSGETHREGRAEIRVSAETDSVYRAAPDSIELRGAGFAVVKGATINGEELASDAVLWNPWVDKSQRMADFGDLEFHKMLCLEPGLVREMQTLPPGQSATLWQELKRTSASSAI